MARYTAELSVALAETFPGDRVFALSDQPVPALAGPPNLRRHSPKQSPWVKRWWSAGLPRELVRLRAGIFHGTGFSVPYVPVCPSVLTLHDLSPWLDRAWHTDAGRVRSRTPLLLGLGLATMVITPTEAIRRQAIEFFRLAPGRVVSVPHAAPVRFRPIPAPPATPPYFLFVGTLEPRKNLHMLIEAWRDVRRRKQVDLILAGRRRADCLPLPELDGLHVIGPVAEEELPSLYSRALACVYPSFYEGFGLPVLEAMQCGTAVIASNDPAISEVAGEAALLLPAGSPRAWAEALHAAAAEPASLDAWRRLALCRAAQFSWTRTARLTREVYEEARRRFGR